MKFVLKIGMLMLITLIAQAEVQLRFQPEININAETLGDILSIKNDDQHWAKLKLDSQPQAETIISRGQILQWMQAQKGAFNWQWQGKTKTKVKAKLQSSGEDLLAKAQTALSEELAKSYSRFELKALSKPKGSLDPIDSFQAHIQSVYPSAKRVCVWMTNHHQQQSVWFAVKAYQPVLVAQHTLRPRTVLKQQDFIWKERNIAGLRKKPSKNIPQEAWLATSLQKDQILMAEQLGKIPSIQQGQTAQVKVHNQAITITIEALALSDGYSGQLIEMRNLMSQKTFTAKVIAEQLAEIVL